jgi:hypothetical protein
MQWKRTALVLGTVALAGTTVATVAARSPASAKQRVAFEIRLNLATGKGTFTLLPLTAGPLKRDSGTLVGGGDIKPAVIRENGQRMTLIVGHDNHVGKHGTFQLAQRVESVNAGRGWSADTGTWSFVKGTGAYAGLSGGGGFASVGPPTGILFAREEGYVSKG